MSLPSLFLMSSSNYIFPTSTIISPSTEKSWTFSCLISSYGYSNLIFYFFSNLTLTIESSSVRKKWTLQPILPMYLIGLSLVYFLSYILTMISPSNMKSWVLCYPMFLDVSSGIIYDVLSKLSFVKFDH